MLAAGCDSTSENQSIDAVPAKDYIEARTPQNAAAALPSAEPAGSEQLASVIAFRKIIGFTADEETVRSILSETAAGGGASEPGGAFTDEEQAEMEVRQELVALAPRIREHFAPEPNRFGGLYLDNLGGGILRILLTGPAEEADRSFARDIYPSRPERIDFSEVRLSFSALQDSFSRLSRDLAQLPDTGVPAVDVTLDEAGNRVVLGVESQLAPPQNERIQRYGRGVQIEVHPRPQLVSHRETDPLPMKGGLKISTLDYQPGLIINCTSSVSVYRDVPFGILTTKREYGSLTAGHCGGVGDNWTHNNAPIGSGIGFNSYQNIMNGATSIKAGTPESDSQVILLTGLPPKNQVLLGSAGSYQTITSRQSYTADVVGEFTCFAGNTTHSTACGALNNRDYTATYTDPYFKKRITLYHQRLMSPESRPGDSGGAVWYSTQARGIVSGKTGTGYTIFSHVQHALEEVGGGWRVLTFQP
jgi:hypothetical protein